MQEVFIIVSAKIGELDDRSKPTTWLYGIAIRVAANARRKVQRKREDFTAEHDERTDDREDPEQHALKNEARMTLATLLSELVPEQRIVFEMFELEEKTCPEIAEALGIPLGTTYTRLRAARAALVAKAEGL